MAHGKRKPLGRKARFAALAASGFRCRYCGATAHEARLEVDHIVPVSHGGTNDPGNLVAACVSCNGGKGTSAARGSIAWRPLVRDGRDGQWCPGNTHLSSWTEFVVGPPDGSYKETVLVCDACQFIVAVREESAG